MNFIQISGEVSPFGLVKELEGLLSLRIPEKVVKEMDLSESYDQSTARFTFIWWLSEEGNYKPEQTFRELVEQVVQDHDNIEYAIEEPLETLDTGQVMVTFHYKEKSKKGAQAPIKNLEYPISIQVGSNIYKLVSPDSGGTVDILRNGEVIDTSLPSVAFALGKTLKHIIVDLSYMEELSGSSTSIDDIDKDLILSAAEFIANSPVVTDEALKHLIMFVELVTNKKFEPEQAD